MAASFGCPSCQQTIAAEDPPGTQVRCPLCGQAVTVPGGPAPNAPSVTPVMPYGTEPVHPARQGLAIGALVCGCLGVLGCPLIGLVGIVLGIVALVRIGNNPRRFAGRGLAIGGICAGGASLFTTALLVAILLPSLSRARELAKRTVCAANLRGLGQAMYIYAQDDPGAFPAVGAVRSANDGRMRIFQDRTTPPSTADTPSPTVDMWVLVRVNNTTPKYFVCPSTTDVPDPARSSSAYYDFLGPSNLSYAYQYQYDPDRPALGTSSIPTFPLMADANPYVKGGGTASILVDRQSPARGNSWNHSNREGQNVLFQDAHVSFEKGPDAGLRGLSSLSFSRNRDNIYTWFKKGDDVDPGTGAPTATLANPGGRSDAVLVP